MLERKVRDAELMAQRLMQNSEKNCKVSDMQNNNDNLTLYHSQQVLYQTNNENDNSNKVFFKFCIN